MIPTIIIASAAVAAAVYHDQSWWRLGTLGFNGKGSGALSENSGPN